MTADPPKAKPAPDRTSDMSFLDHLEELRWRILKGMMGIGIGVLVAFYFAEFIMEDVLLGPAKADFFVYEWMGIDAINMELQSRRLPGQFFAYWGTLIIVGIIISCPIFFYQIWAFIEPALEKTEKWKSRLNTLFISFFFLLGVAFGYLVLVPFALQFFTQFQISDVVRNDFDINEYFSSLTMWVLSCGIIFQLPVISYFLSKIGLITPEFLRTYRRHAIIVCFVLAALLTPPDPVSQTLIAVPLILLFQLSVFVSKIGARQRKRVMDRALGYTDSDKK